MDVDNVFGGDVMTDDARSLLDDSIINPSEDVVRKSFELYKSIIPRHSLTDRHFVDFARIFCNTDLQKIIDNAKSYYMMLVTFNKSGYDENGIKVETIKKMSQKEMQVNTLNTVVMPSFRCRSAVYGDSLYMKDLDGCWKRGKVKNQNGDDRVIRVKPSNESFRIDIANALMMIFNDWLQYEIADANAKKFIDALRIDEQKSESIMFNDAILTADGEVREFTEFNDEMFSPFYINKSILKILGEHDEKEIPASLDALLDNLSNNDEEVKDFILNTISMGFCIKPSIKSSESSSMLVFDDESGETGKSTFMRAIENAVGEDVVASFDPTAADDERLKVDLLTKLFLISHDSSQGAIREKCAATIKSIVSADSLDVRKLFKEREKFRPLVQVIVCSNGFPKSADKTDAWTRRLSIVTPKEKIGSRRPMPENWHIDVTTSDEVGDWLLGEMVIRSMKITKGEVVIEKPQSVLDNVDYYKSDNSSIDDFIKSELQGITEILSADLKEKYENWCDKVSGVQPLGKDKISRRMRAHGWQEKTIRVSLTNHPSLLDARNRKYPEDLKANVLVKAFVKGVE